MNFNKDNIKIDDKFYRIEEIRQLTNETFSVRLPKAGFIFKPGQHISLSIKGSKITREYSIYSSPNDEHLELLVKEVNNGQFTPKLRMLNVGDLVEIHGPYGRFGVDSKDIDNGKFVFIASGTGITPFRSIIRTFPNINYTLIHGVRYSNEAYDKNEYSDDRYILCTSRDDKGKYNGRLTGYLKEQSFDPQSQFYLCGNSDMIFDAIEILQNKGFERTQINCEIYF